MPSKKRNATRPTRRGEVLVAIMNNKADFAILQVCLLSSGECERVIDITATKTQGVTMRYVPRKSLRVFKERSPELLVPQNRLDMWVVPGS